MVAVFVGLANAFTDLGLSQAIIALPTVGQRHLATAFSFSLASGLLLSLMFCVAGPALAWLYGEPELAWLTGVAGLVFVCNVSVVPIGLLLREKRFKDVAVGESVATLLGIVAGLVSASAGASYWSLALMPIVAAVVQSVLLIRLAPWHAKPGYDPAAASEVWDFSKHLLGAALVGYGGRNFDKLMVGHALGAAPLGLYSRAGALVLIPVSQVTNVVGRVALPTFASISSSADRSREVLLRAVGSISLLTFPLCTGLIVTAADLVPVVLGRRWEEMVPILQVLALAGMMHTVVGAVEWMYQARRRTGLQFRTRTVTAILTVAGAALGLPHGVTAVAVGATIGSVGGGVVSICTGARLIGLPIRRVVWVLSPAALGALLSGTTVTLLREWGDNWHASTRLIMGVLLGAGVYIAYLVIVRPPQFIEATRTVRRLVQSGRGTV